MSLVTMVLTTFDRCSCEATASARHLWEGLGLCRSQCKKVRRKSQSCRKRRAFYGGLEASLGPRYLDFELEAWAPHSFRQVGCKADEVEAAAGDSPKDAR